MDIFASINPSSNRDDGLESAADPGAATDEMEDSDSSGMDDDTMPETAAAPVSDAAAPQWDVRSAVVSEPQLRQLLTEMPAICPHCRREVSPTVTREGISYQVTWVSVM